MFGKSMTVFTLFGFKVKIDISWLFLAVLITWSLARGMFPQYYRGLSPATYWWMGVFGALGLFASIVFHELWHSLVARKFGIPMKEITLFIFGGVAKMDEEPPSPKAEFFMAIAGPAASLVLGAVFGALYSLSKMGNWPLPIFGILGYLATINLILAAFNLVPAFPLDGGRVLRSALWHWKKNLRWATRIASSIGSGFGYLLIGLGMLSIIGGNFIGGFWWMLIGMFVLNASKASYQQLLIHQALEGEPVSRFMHSDPVVVPPSTTIRRFVEDYVYKYHYKMFPVSENFQDASCITTREVKEIPREEWERRTVADAAIPCSAENTITVDTDAMQALSLMNRTTRSRLVVTDKIGRLVGVLTLKDLLQFLALKFDLEDDRLLPDTV